MPLMPNMGEWLGWLCLVLAIASRSASVSAAEAPPKETDPLASAVQRLSDKKVGVRIEAMQRLASHAGAARFVVPLIADRIFDEEGAVRETAFEFLAKMGPAALPAIGRIAERMEDGERQEREKARAALKKICARHRWVASMLGRGGGLSSEKTYTHAVLLAVTSIEPSSTAGTSLLITGFQHRSPIVRSACALAVGRLGQEGEPGVPHLIRALRDHNSQVRAAAAAALGEITQRFRGQGRTLDQPVFRKGVAPNEALEPLIRALKDDVFEVRFEAACSLVAYKGVGNHAVPVLAEAVQGKERGVRCHAANMLRRLGPVAKEAVPALAVALEGIPGGWERVEAMLALAEIGPAAESAVPALLRVWERRTLSRCEVARTLARIAPTRPEVVSLFLGLLDRRRQALGNGDVAGSPDDARDARDEHLASAVVEGLGRAASADNRARLALLAVVRDEKAAFEADRVRLKHTSDAISALGPLVAGNRDVELALTKVLFSEVSSEDERGMLWMTNGHALNTLAANLPADRRCSLLTDAMRHKETQIRKHAATLLGEMGPKAKKSVPVLIAALKDESLSVRALACRALGEIGPDAREAIPALIAAMRLQQDPYPDGPADALSKIGLAAVPALVGELGRDQDRRRGASAFDALKRMGPQAKSAVPALIEIIRKPGDGRARADALYLLRGIGPEAKEAVPELAKLRQERDIGRYLPGVLAGIGEPAVPPLLQLLRQGDQETRFWVLDCLNELGPKAKDATDDVVALLASDDRETRFAAAVALGSIGHRVGAARKVLKEMWRDPELNVRRSALHAMRNMERPDRLSFVVPTATRALDDKTEGPSGDIVYKAIRALGYCGPDAKPSVPKLAELLGDESLGIRDEAAKAIISICDPGYWKAETASFEATPARSDGQNPDR